MSAPSSYDIKGKIIETLPAQFKEDSADLDDELKMRTNYPDSYTADGITKVLCDFLQNVAEGISQGWGIWQSGLSVAGGTVTGSGIDKWSGTGNDSKISGNPPGMVINLTNSTEYSLEFVNAIAAEINTEFQDWADSYKTFNVDYTGTSDATTNSAGTFTATNTLDSLSILGDGTNPVGLSQNVQFGLSQNGPSGVTFDFEKSMAGQFLDAIESALNDLWQNWLTTNVISGLSVSGVALEGTGTGSGMASGGTIQ